MDNDDRAVINVNSAGFYFNITNTATFKNVIFDGINSFAVLNNQINEQFSVPLWPKKLCEIDSKDIRDGNNISTLIQMIDQINQNMTSANDLLSQKGYGYLPLKPA